MRNIIPMELTDLNSSINMAVRPTYGGLPKYGVASGDIASFITNINYPLKKLEADITAQQDLHGYSHPWAGGAGKNKLPFDLDEVKSMNTFVDGSWSGNVYTRMGVSFTVNSDGTIKVNGTSTGTCEFRIAVKNIHSFLVADTPYILNGCPDVGSLSTYRMAITDNITNTYADYGGNGASFTPNSAFVGNNYLVAINVYSGYTANNLLFKPMVRLASVSDATWEPYSNICPIDGFDDVVVNVAGINVWDEQWELGVYNFNTGAKHPNANYIRNVSPISVLADTTYNWRKPADKDCMILFYDKNYNLIGHESLFSDNNRLFTTPNNCAFVNFYIQGTTYDNNISINYPSTETAYHAYNGNTYTTDLDGTRYGGTLDVTTGVLTVTHQLVDLGTLTWNSASDNRFYATVNSTPMGDVSPALCDCYKNALNSWNVLQLYEFNYGENISGGGSCVAIKDDRYANATDFKSAMSGHQLVYPLKNPQTVQLTEQEVESLCGQNHIWANSGQVYVEYHFVEDFEE